MRRNPARVRREGPEEAPVGGGKGREMGEGGKGAEEGYHLSRSQPDVDWAEVGGVGWAAEEVGN